MATKHRRIQQQHADDYHDPYYEDREVLPPPPSPSRRGAVRPYTSHVITARQLSTAEPRLRRFLAVLIWFFSLYGNVLAFGGGWLGIFTLESSTLAAVAIAIIYQVLCTAIQFVTCARLFNPLYLIALFASVVPSFVGYRPYVAVPIARVVAGIDGDVFASFETAMGWHTQQVDAFGLALAVHIIVFLVFIAVDVIPERIFIQHA